MLKTLVISGYGVTVGYSKGCLVVREGNGRGGYKVPLADLDQVIITTSGVKITSKAIRAMIDYGVDLVVLDSRGYPAARLYPPYISRTVDTRRKQYLAYNDLNQARNIVVEIAYCKIRNQLEYLRRIYSRTRIEEFREAVVKMKEYLNELLSLSISSLKELRRKVILVESKAAHTYWSHIALITPSELEFPGRNQDSDDLVNVLLNYSYSIIYSVCWKAIALAGLDPYAGFLHIDRSGKPVLVFDFIEMFRVVAVDHVIVSLINSGWRTRINNGLLPPEARSHVCKLILENLKRRYKCIYWDEKLELIQWIKRTAYNLADSIRNNSKFKGFIVRW